MAGAFEFILNGRSVRVENCPPHTTLLEHLRKASLTGSKEGCAEGDCGACSVVIVESDVDGKGRYRSINSCLVPLPSLAGREVISVEGVASNSLHPVQEKMVKCHGSQCGYCTPGFIMSMFEGYYRSDLNKEWQLEDQLCGNLCRCTGYRSIHDAAVEAWTTTGGDDKFANALKERRLPLGAVEYATDEGSFLRPTSLTELLKILKEQPGARMVAGATELGLEITKRYKKFPTLVSIEAVPELQRIDKERSEWKIGAAVSLTRLEETLAEEYPALGRMLRVFGSRQIRNRATLGGNLATASPIGDNAPVLLALDASIVIASLTGERTVPLGQFFVGYRKTALQPGEVLKTIIIPRGNGAGAKRYFEWYKVSKRREMDISTVAACFVVDVDAAGIVKLARLAYGGVAATTVRAKKAEVLLVGNKWSRELIRQVLPTLKSEFAPISDVRGNANYRNELIGSLFEKFYIESTGSKTADSASIRRSLSDSNSALPHESAHKHVTGEAIYTDDQTTGMLEVWPVCSPHASAKIIKRDASVARKMPGIRAVLLAEDVPGLNDVGAVLKEEILLADKVVSYHGHLVALVVGESQELCRAAAEKVIVEYEPLPAVLTLSEAIRQESFHNKPNYIRRGNADEALQRAELMLDGEFELGGQEHFYLETHAAWAERGEDGSIHLVSSTQHPSEVQNVVAHVLHLPINKVVVQSPRMGGGFGGKETQANTPSALAALAAHHTGKRVRVRFNRDQDMMLSGHRHPFLARFKVGFDSLGTLLALKAELYSNGGWAMDLSQAVTDRALFHLDNSYYLPAVRVSGTCREDQPFLKHRVPRVWRATRDAGDRGNHRPGCPSPGITDGGGARAKYLPRNG